MADLKKINLDGQDLDIFDATARSTATGAASTAQTALSKVTEIEKLSRVTVSYTAASATLAITTGTHE